MTSRPPEGKAQQTAGVSSPLLHVAGPQSRTEGPNAAGCPLCSTTASHIEHRGDVLEQPIGMRRPADRFHAGTAIPVPVADESAVRPGPMEIQRRVWSNGVVRVAYQAVSVGRPYAGELVTIRVQGGILHVFHDGRLVRSVPRNNRREVRYIRGRRSPPNARKAV
jgi:hypothetical protein